MLPRRTLVSGLATLREHCPFRKVAADRHQFGVPVLAAEPRREPVVAKQTRGCLGTGEHWLVSPFDGASLNAEAHTSSTRIALMVPIDGE
jgi:hypothetical protein